MIVALAAIALVIAAAWFMGPVALRAIIRRRLRGYVRDANVVDRALPTVLERPRTVAVIGAGVAGLTAAVTLARRGFAVTLIESNGYIGGKLGSWRVQLMPPSADINGLRRNGGAVGTPQLGPDEHAWVSHGFHAFFPHYHNLRAFLESVGSWRAWTNIGDYVIMGNDGDVIRFGGLERTPVLNLVALARAGVFELSEALAAPGRDLYGVFLEYEHDDTVARYDHLSFARFAEIAKVPPRLKLAFDTFARAFFADEDKLSMGELLKSFHFYYLGHDGGLDYDYPPRDYGESVLSPIRDDLECHGAKIRLNTAVQSIAKSTNGYEVDGEAFDSVVVATHSAAANALVTNAVGLPDALAQTFEKLVPGQRYAVLRAWIDKAPRNDLPPFVITDRVRVLDAFAVYDRIEAESSEWVTRHGGSVVELHCYAVPDEMSEEELKRALKAEMVHFFPELRDCAFRHEAWQCKRDFTAFHVGMHADRPVTESGVEGLVFAGDWVKLPFPAMLLEAACSSGLCAANALLREQGLREERVRSVPLRGLMAGMPQPKARDVLRPTKD